MNPVEFAQNMKSMLKSHPEGTHFCMASEESGFALNAKDFMEYILSTTKLADALEIIVTNQKVGTQINMKEWERDISFAKEVLTEYRGHG